MKKLSIIIVHYRNDRETKTLLDHLLNKSNLPFEHEIILVLNSELQLNENTVSKIKLIDSKGNPGFARAVNSAYRISTGENFLLLNPDIVPQKNSIDKMYRFFISTKEIGILLPKLILPDGKRQFSVRRFYKFKDILYSRIAIKRKKYPHFYCEHLMTDIEDDKYSEVDWGVGACMMINGDFIKKTGTIFDPRFYLYFEDVDLCLRCRKRGFRVIYNPNIKFFHHHRRESRSFLKKAAIFHLSSFIKFYLKYLGLSQRN